MEDNKAKLLISGDGSKRKALIRAIVNGDIQVIIPDEINKTIERLMKDRNLIKDIKKRKDINE